MLHAAVVKAINEMLKNKKKLMTYLFLGVGLMGIFILALDMVYAAGSGVTINCSIARPAETCSPTVRLW